jgi:hypothetical protein
MPHHHRDEPEHESDDELVEVLNVSEFSAEVAAAHLRSAGIEAAVFGTGDMRLTASEGARVMVRRRDAERAAEILASGDPA